MHLYHSKYNIGHYEQCEGGKTQQFHFQFFHFGTALSYDNIHIFANFYKTMLDKVDKLTTAPN